MKPRDLVFDTLELSSPKRVPRDLWMLPWATNNYPQKVKMIQERFPNDFSSPPVHYAKPIQTTGDPYKIGTYTDEWGCTFDNIQAGVIGEVRSPQVKSWDDWQKVYPPADMLNFDKDAVNAYCHESDRFVFGG